MSRTLDNGMLFWKYTIITKDSDPALCDCCNCDCLKYYTDDTNTLSVYVLCEFCFGHRGSETPEVCKSMSLCDKKKEDTLSSDIGTENDDEDEVDVSFVLDLMS